MEAKAFYIDFENLDTWITMLKHAKKMMYRLKCGDTKTLMREYDEMLRRQHEYDEVLRRNENRT